MIAQGKECLKVLLEGSPAGRDGTTHGDESSHVGFGSGDVEGGNGAHCSGEKGGVS